MKDLKSFQTNLHQDALLSTDDMKTVQGGRRFITKDYYAFYRKVSKLIRKGKTFATGFHNNEYCIEW